MCTRCTYVCMCVGMFVYACRQSRLTVGIFVHCVHFTLCGRVSQMNVEIDYMDSVLSQPAPRIPFSASQCWDYRPASMPAQHLCAFWWLDTSFSSLHSKCFIHWGQCFIPHLPNPMYISIKSSFPSCSLSLSLPPSLPSFCPPPSLSPSLLPFLSPLSLFPFLSFLLLNLFFLRFNQGLLKMRTLAMVQSIQLQQLYTNESPSKFQIASPTWIQNTGLQRGFSMCQAENTRFLWRWTYLNSFLLSLLILIGKVVPLCCLGKQERTEGEPTKEKIIWVI